MDPKKMQKEIEATLLRNLRILTDVTPDRLGVPDVTAMLRAAAANLAQMYAHRVREANDEEDAAAERLYGPLDEPHHSVDRLAKLVA